MLLIWGSLWTSTALPVYYMLDYAVSYLTFGALIGDECTRVGVAIRHGSNYVSLTDVGVEFLLMNFVWILFPVIVLPAAFQDMHQKTFSSQIELESEGSRSFGKQLVPIYFDRKFEQVPNGSKVCGTGFGDKKIKYFSLADIFIFYSSGSGDLWGYWPLFELDYWTIFAKRIGSYGVPQYRRWFEVNASQSLWLSENSKESIFCV